jgi:uncharacterized RDD family membrane protein YckC
MTNKIRIIAFATAIAGIIAETLAFMNISTVSLIKILLNVKGIFTSLSLHLFKLRFFEHHTSSGLGSNYLNLFFYILLLLGAIFFTTSKQKETRLLRFVFSIILVSQVLAIVLTLISPIVYWKYLIANNFWWAIWILNLGIGAGWIYLSLFVIKNTKKELDISYKELNGHKLPEYNFASNWQRLFHFIIDTYICLLIFSTLIYFYGNELVVKVESVVGERGLIYIFLITYRLVYYPFFEILLGATPAKLLTETRVVTQDGNKAPAGTIVLRTLSRFIPFEPFSFFGAGGWHDTITKTEVVREVRTGVKGRLYLLIFPAIILIGLGIYFGKEEYEDYQYRKKREAEHQLKIQELESSLNHITTNDLIQIEELNSYGSKEIYLKVEEVTKEELAMAVIEKENDYNESVYSIEKLYNQNKNYLSTIPVKLRYLKKAYTADYNQYRRNKRNGVKLLMDDREFEIKRIEKLNCPIIKEGGVEYARDSSIEMSFINSGWPADLIEIENIEGSVKWENQLPEHIKTITSDDYPNFYISGSNYKKKDKLKFRIVLRDSLDNRHGFIIEKVKDTKIITRE